VQSAFHQVSFVNSDEILKAELAKALAECERLREENAQLRLRIGEDLEGGHQDVEGKLGGKRAVAKWSDLEQRKTWLCGVSYLKDW
jgi:regulator of replication initiation timing